MIARFGELFQDIGPCFPTGDSRIATVALGILVADSLQIMFPMTLKTSIVANAC